jgi:tRNA (Thr-GGU) A37 N-methylase
MEITMKPIGYIESEFKEKKDIPRQSVYYREKKAKGNNL